MKSGDMAAPRLTSREREVLIAVVRGESNPEIALLLFIASATTKIHVRHLLAKFEVESRPKLMIVGREWLLAHPEPLTPRQ
jgi:DNA-binding NarL/FixJ family response regulator